MLNPLGNIHKNQNRTPLKWIYFYCIQCEHFPLLTTHPAVCECLNFSYSMRPISVYLSVTRDSALFECSSYAHARAHAFVSCNLYITPKCDSATLSALLHLSHESHTYIKWLYEFRCVKMCIDLMTKRCEGVV